MVLGGYFLLAWPVLVVFFLGPLAGLLIADRPSSRREWLWIATVGIWAAVWLGTPGGIADQALRASGVFFTGAFVALVLIRRQPGLTPALWALAAAAIGLVLWAQALGITWGQLEMAFTTKGWASYHALADQLTPGQGRTPATALLDSLAAGVETAARFTPATTALMALAGVALARAWQPRIAARRPPWGLPGPFRGFRLSDHLVWAVIAGLGVVLFGGGPLATLLAVNGLVVLGALYGVQGTAVVWALVLEPLGWRAVAVAVAGGVVLMPFAMASLVAMGIADTWIAFRRRLKPLSQGGNR